MGEGERLTRERMGRKKDTGEGGEGEDRWGEKLKGGTAEVK